MGSGLWLRYPRSLSERSVAGDDVLLWARVFLSSTVVIFGIHKWFVTSDKARIIYVLSQL